MQVGQRTVHATLDGGAQFSVITQNLVAELGLEDLVEEALGTYTTASGHIERPAGKIRGLEIVINHYKYILDLIVTRAVTYDMLLGMDIQKSNRVTPIWDSSRVRLCTGTCSNLEHTVPMVWKQGSCMKDARATFMTWRDDSSFADGLSEPQLRWSEVASNAKEKLELEKEKFDVVGFSGGGIFASPGQSNVAATIVEEAADEGCDDGDSVEFFHMVECEKDLKAYIEVQAPSTAPTVHQITSQDEVWTSASPSHPCHSDQHNPVEQMHDPRPPDGIQLPSNDQAMDRSDWQILPRHFSNYNAAYGPYTLDACADNLGLNAMVSTYWTAKEDCCKMDWAGHNAWANPPLHLAGEVLQRFLTCKRSRPEDTAATFVLPVWKTASWWRLLEDNFRVVDYYPPNSSVFTGSPLKAGEARRAVGGLPWPVAVIQCPYGPLGAAKDMPSTKLFHELPDPSVTDKQMEGIQAIQVNAQLANDQRASVDELLQSHAQRSLLTCRAWAAPA